MDLISLNIIVGLICTIAMFAAIIFMLTYVLGTFSSRSGAMSLKLVFFSLVYFLGSTILLVAGAMWFNDLASVPTNGRPYFLAVGASALALNALLHIASALLTAFMYVRGRMSRVRRM